MRRIIDSDAIDAASGRCIQRLEARRTSDKSKQRPFRRRNTEPKCRDINLVVDHEQLPQLRSYSRRTRNLDGPLERAGLREHTYRMRCDIQDENRRVCDHSILRIAEIAGRAALLIAEW